MRARILNAECSISTRLVGEPTREVTVTPYRERLDNGEYQQKQTARPKRTPKPPAEPVPDEADDKADAEGS